MYLHAKAMCSNNRSTDNSCLPSCVTTSRYKSLLSSDRLCNLSCNALAFFCPPPLDDLPLTTTYSTITIMLSALSGLLSPRSSSETTRSRKSHQSTASTSSSSSASSSSSSRSYRVSTDTCMPPSVVCGTSTKPHIELAKPVWEIDNRKQ